MRTKKSIYNITATVVSYFTQIVTAFILRRAFLSVFGLDYVGVESVFANILSLLSLAELGIGSAITYRLFKPLAEGNHREVALLMGAYRRLYQIVALLVLGLGIALSSFLPFLIPDAPVIPKTLFICFYLYLIQTVSTYFLAYKRGLLLADQNQYVTVFVDTVCTVIQFVVRLLVLYYTKNYILYLTIGIVRAIIANVVISMICDRTYPYLNNKEYQKKKAISLTMKDMSLDIRYIFLHRIAGYVYSSTDGVVISSFLGVAQAGLVANYNLIAGTVSSLFNQVSNAIQPSMGSFVSVNRENREMVWQLIKRMNYLAYTCLSFCAISLFCLLGPFIRLWIGEDYLLPQTVVFLISFNFFLYSLYFPIANLYTVLGLFNGDKFTSPIAAIVNLTVSILTVKYYGLIGIYIGTILSSLVFIIGRTQIVYRKYFQRSSIQYYCELFKYLLITCGEGVITALCMGILKEYGFADFLIRVLLCIFVPNLINIILFHRTAEFQYTKNLIVKTFRLR